jgi:hypothetical protein
MSVALHGTAKAAGDGHGSAKGYAVEVSLTIAQGVGGDEPLRFPAGGSARVAPDATWAIAIEIPDGGEPQPPIALTVAAPDGTVAVRYELEPADLDRLIELEVPLVARPTIEAVDNPAPGQRPPLTGRVVDKRGRETPVGLPVVIYAQPIGGGDPTAVVVTATQPGGFFTGLWPSTTFASAEGRVDALDPVPIRLGGDDRLPRDLLLVLDLADLPDDHEDCACHAPPPRVPEPADLSRNPAAFSQDLGGGCVDLATPNRTIEEFTYTFVIRTSEPQIKALTLGRRRTVPPALLSDLLSVSLAAEALVPRTTATPRASITPLTIDARSAKFLVRADQPPAVAEVSRAAWLSEVADVKGVIDAGLRDATARTPLDADHPIDWDDTPTIHQTIELAHGHVLHMREVWRADGYSLGDLLYSLPLAPLQRRRIAVVDWERRTEARRTEQLESEEQLQALLAFDRDVREIVGSHLDEQTAGGSSSTTWGAAGGIGAGFIGTGFGIFAGVAGGYSSSEANAWQRSSRTFAADSMQRLHDRVSQRASALRDVRSTVVQSVAEGETLRAETEVVANYNRCHAITIEYFEVLRHFIVSHELASVSECLFVPFPLEPFDRGKALRWREPLSRHLRAPELRGGFDAIRRVADNWVGWDYPEARYSQEAPETLEGELRISFVLPRPRDAADGAFQYAEWQPYRNWFGIDLAEIFRRLLQPKTPAQRDAAFRAEIAPQIAANLVQGLRFAYVTAGGGEVEVPLDPTLVSRYAEGVPLYVSLAPRGAVPAVPREDITYFKLWFDGDPLPPDARVIVHTGRVRYTAAHSSALLVDAPQLLDDLGPGDPAVAATPLSLREKRDPRAEDRRLADRLVAHLNSHLEHYHQAIWLSLDAQRRHMLLDGIVVPGLGGQSVASVCANQLLGIVGNTLVLPLAPGRRLDPTLAPAADAKGDDDGTPPSLIDAYAADAPPPLRVSVPTRGVYAEAISGECNACEHPDDSRYWRWSTEGLLAPPLLDTVSTDSRASDIPNLRPSELPTPLVSIQNAPDVPAPASLAGAFDLLALHPFEDVTGLEGSQRNAMAAFEASTAAAAALGQEAGKLAGQNELGRTAGRMVDRIAQAQKDGLLTPDVAQLLTYSALQGAIGEDRQKSGTPEADPAAQSVLTQAANAGKADIKVTKPEETVEASFDDAPVVGAGPTKNVTRMLPGSRPCCALGQWEVPGLSLPGALDPGALGGQKYGPSGGAVGYVYTAKAGLIDFGHARDTANMTKFVLDALIGGFARLELYEGIADIPAIPASDADRLELAAAISYAESWAHELQTWDDYSSFSPEDLTSNIVGIEVAKRAITAGGPYEAEIDAQFTAVLTELGARSKADTQAVLNKIKNDWYKLAAKFGVPLELLRRNFDGDGWMAGMPFDAGVSLAWLSPAAFEPQYSKFSYTMTHSVNGKRGVKLSAFQHETDALRKIWVTAHPGKDRP